MGLEFVRGNSTKCSPFLLCGLIIMCLFLVCNWWSLSSQNFELLKQIDNLAEQLRANGEELSKCSQQHILLDEKLKDSQTRFVQQQIKIEQIKETEDDVKEGYKSIQSELNETKKKYESMERVIKICNAEKDSLQKLIKSQEENLKSLLNEKKNLLLKMDENNKKIILLEEKLNSTNKSDLKGNQTFSLLRENQMKIKKLPTIKNEKTENSKIEQNVVKNKYFGQLQEIEDFKNAGDSSHIPLENEDPREQAMKESEFV